MSTLITVIHVFTCVLLVLVVLVQQGKGAEISASFGGSSQTVFGSSGGANFFTRFTQGAAAVFMCTSVILTIMGGQSKKSLFEGTMAPPIQTSAPAGAPIGAAPGTGKGVAAPASGVGNAPAPGTTAAKPVQESGSH